MRKEEEQLEAIQDIRKMMKESSKFLTLSGLSGVFAGVYALIGAYLGYQQMIHFNEGYLRGTPLFAQEYVSLVTQVILICGTVLVLSIITALYFSKTKAKKNNQKLFDHTSKKLLWSMALPLFAGGLFCIALVYHGNGLVLMVSPVMLIFYGLALVASSKFTFHDVKYLGYLELLLGLLASFFLGFGLEFWAVGFGLLHIIYGTIMWYKYDRAK